MAAEVAARDPGTKDEFVAQVARGLVPFVTFETARHHYIYDAPTNAIVRTDAMVNARALAFYRGEPLPEDASGEQRAADAFLDKLRRYAGILVPQAPARVISRVDKEHVRNCRDEVVSVVLNVTEACNIRCSYCVYGGAYEDKRVHNNGRMTWEVAKKAIDYMASHSEGSPHKFRTLAWYGGEPLTNFKLMRQTAAYFAELFPNYRRKYNVTSNAVLWTPEIMDFFAEYDVDLLVSMDGPKEVHDRSRVTAKGLGTFERVVGNLRALEARHPAYFRERVSINAVLTPPIDFKVLDAFFTQFPVQITTSTVDPPSFEGPLAERAVATGWSEMRAKFKQGCLERAFDDRSFKDKGYNFVYYQFIRDMQKIHRRVSSTGFEDELAGHGCCTPGQDRIFVNARGGFETCEKTEGTDLMSLGDVDRGVDPERTIGIFERFNDMNYAPCRSCYNVRLCSLCFAHTKSSDEFDSIKRYWNCENLRAGRREMLSMYCEILEEDPTALDFILTKLRD